MTPPDQLARDAEELARELESSIPLATTRIEHIRVSGQATRARAIAQELAALVP